MQEKSLIKKNILQYLEIKDITKYKFYQKTGITRGVLDKNNGMSEENTARIIAYFKDINPIWLLTGQGEMILGNEKKPLLLGSSQVLNEPREVYGNPPSDELVQLRERLKEKDELIESLKETNRLLREEVGRLRGSEPVTRTA